jgi:hypothetical protein
LTVEPFTEDDAEEITLPGIPLGPGPANAAQLRAEINELTARAANAELPVHRAIESAYDLGWRCAERHFASQKTARAVVRVESARFKTARPG